MNDLLLQTLLVMPVLVLNGYLAIRVDHWLNKKREQRFLKHVRIKYPDSTIMFTSIETSDAQAMHRLRDQLEES